MTVRNVAQRLAREEDGATAVEYGLMLVAIAALIVVVVTSIGSKTEDNFSAAEQLLN
ncbi:MAG: Flp family type IVb pilin [Pirellulaceae bacterium]|nr:Flp family type IVb pilin [Pirellulaceae bacterium]